MYYVYLLKSLRDSKFYTGFSNDPEKRLKLHNSGQVSSTKSRRPLVLVGWLSFDSTNKARYYEYQLKKHSDKKNKFIREIERVSDPATGLESLWLGKRSSSRLWRLRTGGGVAQLVRALACHARGRGFESRRSHHSDFTSE